MLPSTGWLPSASANPQPFVATSLPEVYSSFYGDGAQGVYAPVETDEIFSIMTDQDGIFSVVTEFGLVSNIPGFKVTFNRFEAYGTLLVDRIDPAFFESVIEEPPPFDPPEVQELCPPAHEYETVEACCHVIESITPA